MNRLLFVSLCFVLVTNTLLAQQGSYDIAVSYGFYQAPKYEHAVNKTFLAADFEYHILKRWTISTGFLSGQFRYFEDWRSNAFDYNDYTNAKGYESHAYLTGSYSLIHNQKFNLQAGAGVGLYTQRLKYPYASPSSGGAPSQGGGQIFTGEESISMFEVPLKVSGFYMLNSHIGVGFKSGIFLQLNRPLSGTYVGPQLRVRL